MTYQVGSSSRSRSKSSSNSSSSQIRAWIRCQVVEAASWAMHKCVPRRFRSGALECDGSAVAEGGCCLNEWHGDGDEESIWQLLV